MCCSNNPASTGLHNTRKMSLPINCWTALLCSPTSHPSRHIPVPPVVLSPTPPFRPHSKDALHCRWCWCMNNVLGKWSQRNMPGCPPADFLLWGFSFRYKMRTGGSASCPSRILLPSHLLSLKLAAAALPWPQCFSRLFARDKKESANLSQYPADFSQWGNRGSRVSYQPQTLPWQLYYHPFSKPTLSLPLHAGGEQGDT